MITRITVGSKPGILDVLGEAKRKAIRDFLGIPLTEVQTRRVYTLNAKLTPQELEAVEKRLLVDPVTQRSFASGGDDFNWLVEVGYKPGVTDNVARTARLAVIDIIERRLDPEEGLFTSTQFLLKGGLSRGDAWRIARELLANELIESITVLSAEEVRANVIQIPLPIVSGEQETGVGEISLEVSDEELVRISREGVLALSLDEMKTIRDYYRRPEVTSSRSQRGLGPCPTDVELEMLAQTWSEHCKHKIFNARILYKDMETGESENVNSLFRTYIRAATEKAKISEDWLVSVFSDNAGVVAFNDHLNVVVKVETHNSPSALEPYGGALTGIVGVNRDPMGTGKGAKLMFNVFTYCLGDPFYKGDMPPRMLHPRRIRDGVHKGVIDGGNQSGIPLARGREIFHPRYGEEGGKPLVYCGTIGTMPRLIDGETSESKRIVPGEYIVMVGGRIGKDGIHGATFSSEELHKGSPTQAVQIGDPITQKKMGDLLLEARDQGLYTAITDNGAGGLSSSVGEMAQTSGGCEVWLDRAPLKYPGLAPWEILLSEAQERMTLAVEPSKAELLLSLAKKREVEATIIGRFTDSGEFIAKHGDRVVAALDMCFLHEGLPQKVLRAEWKKPLHEEPNQLEPDDYNRVLKDMLTRLNICSIEAKLRQYDHEVKGLSIVKPLVGVECDCPSDATVNQLEYGSKEGLIIAEGICPNQSDIDTYNMAQSAMDEALRRVIAAGGRLPGPDTMLSVLDNFCWCDPEPAETNPDASYKAAQLVRACKGAHDYAVFFDIPFISGKDSMKNDSVIDGKRVSIPPTLLVTAIAKLDDVEKTVTLEAKTAGDIVYLLGVTKDEPGASEYLRYLGEKARGNPYLGNRVPSVDLEGSRRCYEALSRAIDKGLVNSAHALTIGGLGVGLALVTFGGMRGLEVDLSKAPVEEQLDDPGILFNESNGRFLITVPEKKKVAFEETMAGCPCSRIGEVSNDTLLRVSGARGHLIIEADISDLKKAWKTTLRGA
jgi:phosphoribosylformylglycinamidine synthase